MAEHVKVVSERRVENLLEFDVLERKTAARPLVVHFVVAEMVLEMTLHVAELFEQVVKVFEQIVEVEVLRFEAAVFVEVVVAHLIVLATFFRVSQNFIGLGDLTKLFLRPLLTAFVWVIF